MTVLQRAMRGVKGLLVVGGAGKFAQGSQIWRRQPSILWGFLPNCGFPGSAPQTGIRRHEKHCLPPCPHPQTPISPDDKNGGVCPQTPESWKSVGQLCLLPQKWRVAPKAYRNGFVGDFFFFQLNSQPPWALRRPYPCKSVAGTEGSTTKDLLERLTTIRASPPP